MKANCYAIGYVTLKIKIMIKNVELPARQKAENVKLWIETLRKNEVKQGYNSLGGPEDGYCCLGVACEIMDLDFKPEDPISHILVGKIGLFSEAGGFYDHEHKRYTGFKFRSNTCVKRAEDFSGLAAINDSECFEFPQIADIIFEKRKFLFHANVVVELEKIYNNEQ